MREYITLNYLSKNIKCNEAIIKEAMFYLGLFEYDKNYNYILTKKAGIFIYKRDKCIYIDKRITRAITVKALQLKKYYRFLTEEIEDMEKTLESQDYWFNVL